MTEATRLFQLGRIVITPGAAEMLEATGEAVSLAAGRLLARHAAGDWGDLSDDDKQANDAALETGARLWSAYTVGNLARFYVITDAARKGTTICLTDKT